MEQNCFLHTTSRFYSIGLQLFTSNIYNREEQRHAATLFINSATYATINSISEFPGCRCCDFNFKTQSHNFSLHVTSKVTT